MYDLPTSIVIENKEYLITNKGDFHVILDCFAALEDAELDERFRIYSALIIFYEDINSIEDIVNVFSTNCQKAVNEMYNFFNCGQQNIGMTVQHKLIDWDQDSQMISAALNNVARKEIRSEPYIHWWTFMGYYCSVGESTLATVVSIRYKIVAGKKLEKYEKEFKRNNPEYFTWRSRNTQQQENDKLARQLWNSN